MLKQDVKDFLDQLLGLPLRDVGEWCDEVLDAEKLLEEIEEAGPFAPSRKRLCQYLDIAESTLSGWLKEDRIPRLAKEAYVLLLVFEVMREEIREREQVSEELKIVDANGRFLICRHEDGGGHGRVIGEAASLEWARRMAMGASPRTAILLDEVSDSLGEFVERLEEMGVDASWYSQLGSRAADQSLLITDYDAWKRKKTDISDRLTETVNEGTGGDKADENRGEADQ